MTDVLECLAGFVAEGAGQLGGCPTVN